jgi:L-serine dehydratase
MAKIMSQRLPSIFNDVIGPVMRGPSSSHCAAALRIGRMARELMGGNVSSVRVQLDPHGSLATTFDSQGSAMGLCGGLLGWEADDPRLIDYDKAMRAAGIKIEVEIVDLAAAHPNTYRLMLRNATERHEMTALSTGGGMVEMIALDGVSLSIGGDYHETLVYCGGDAGTVLQTAEQYLSADEIRLLSSPGRALVEIKSGHGLSPQEVHILRQLPQVIDIKAISPVLPILSHRSVQVPFISCQEMLAYNQIRNLSLWQLAAVYESERGGISQQAVWDHMQGLVYTMRHSIAKGLAGSDYADRILHRPAAAFLQGLQSGRLLEAGILNRMILYATALMEAKSAMEVIVAAPTAGSCGALPGACIAAAEGLGLADDRVIQALLSAGMIGVLIAARSTLAAEQGGCQAECGAASGMAAAGLVELAGGSTGQSLAAASMALQNIFGMVCDPVAKRVEVPCLGKNVLALANALACANMALAGLDPVIPLDEVIDAMDQVGRSLPRALRCTALGGLSLTPAAKALEARLGARRPAAPKSAGEKPR